MAFFFLKPSLPRRLDGYCVSGVITTIHGTYVLEQHTKVYLLTNFIYNPKKCKVAKIEGYTNQLPYQVHYTSNQTNYSPQKQPAIIVGLPHDYGWSLCPPCHIPRCASL